jgi:cytochrome c
LAQSPTYKVGRPPTEDELHRGNNIVGSDGRELPPGKGTAKEGAALFAAKCAFCHGQNGEGMFPNPRLVGGVGTLNTPHPIKTVGSNMPYATTIWDFINRAMPPWPYEKGASPDRSLTPDNVYALTAFLLYKNGIIRETDVMDKNSLVEIQMPNRHGFYPDPPQSAPDKDHSWQPYWDQVKPGADASVK